MAVKAWSAGPRCRLKLNLLLPSWSSVRMTPLLAGLYSTKNGNGRQIVESYVGGLLKRFSKNLTWGEFGGTGDRRKN